MTLLEPPTGLGIFLVLRAEKPHDDAVTVSDLALALDHFTLCFDAASLAAKGIDPDPEETEELDAHVSPESPVVRDLGMGSIQIVLDLTPWAAAFGGIAVVAQVLFLFEKYRNVSLRLAVEAAALEELLATKGQVAEQERQDGSLSRLFERLSSERDLAMSATDLAPVEGVLTTDPEEASL